MNSGLVTFVTIIVFNKSVGILTIKGQIDGKNGENAS